MRRPQRPIPSRQPLRWAAGGHCLIVSTVGRVDGDVIVAASHLGHVDVHQLGHFGGLADELEGLKRDKNILMVELVRLRQQQQVHNAHQCFMPNPGPHLTPVVGICIVQS